MNANYLRKIFKKIIAKATNRKQRIIIEIPLQARFGNLLYFFLHCFIEQKKGKNTYILYTETMSYWLNFFPSLKEFIIYPDEYRKIDNLTWMDSYYQDFNKDFTLDDLNLFIKNKIITNSIFLNSRTINKLVINIRRGDFYSDKNINTFGFDQIFYLKEIFKKYKNSFNISIEIVSDDIEWCKRELSFINDYSNNIQYETNKSPIEDFMKICTANQLIITNSTFSYWGAYINNVINPKSKIFVPDFGSKEFKDYKAIQLNPNWEIIKCINI